MTWPAGSNSETSGTGASLNTQTSLLAPPFCMETEWPSSAAATRASPPA